METHTHTGGLGATDQRDGNITSALDGRLSQLLVLQSDVVYL